MGTQNIERLRQQTTRLAHGLDQVAAQCRRMLAQLPEISEPVLAFAEPPDRGAALSMALEQAVDELPELVMALRKAAASTEEELHKDHAALIKRMADAEIPMPPGGKEGPRW